jgi:hypothetical protein
MLQILACLGTLRPLLPYRRTNLFLWLPQTLSSQHSSAIASFRARRVICCAPSHSPDAPRRRPFTPFNFQRARIRRKGGFLQVVESKARKHVTLHAWPARACDSTLRLSGSYPDATSQASPVKPSRNVPVDLRVATFEMQPKYCFLWRWKSGNHLAISKLAQRASFPPTVWLPTGLALALPPWALLPLMTCAGHVVVPVHERALGVVPPRPNVEFEERRYGEAVRGVDVQEHLIL